MTGNIERYPSIIEKPRKVNIFNKEYTVYKFRFRSLTELYNYLKSEPNINTEAFSDYSELSSINGNSFFAGIPYEEAVEKLVNYHDPQYKNFLSLSKKIKAKDYNTGATFKSVNSVAGGIIRPIAIATGDPYIYKTTKIIKNSKEINLYSIISYLQNTTSKQVRFKAIILTNIIHALEEAGLRVNVNAFSTATKDDELIEIDLDIKRINSGINYQALYRSHCEVEFLRRIIFRVRETSDVKNPWRDGYGRSREEDFNREYFKIGKDDLYFGTPDELGIDGKDISEDFENAVNRLHLEDKMDVKRAKEILRKSKID